MTVGSRIQTWRVQRHFAGDWDTVRPEWVGNHLSLTPALDALTSLEKAYPDAAYRVHPGPVVDAPTTNREA